MKLLPGKVPQIFFMLLFACVSFTSFAQTPVSGKVTDSKDNSPLANVSVRVKSSGQTVQTGADGSYRVDAPSANAVLIFTSVGYASQEAAANGGSLSISLVQTNTQLQDVVVVAYGTRRKSDLTGAVVSVGPREFQKGQITSSEQLLQGKVAGLAVTTGGGAAGGGSALRIRGLSSINLSSDPLIVIDGVPVDNNGLAGSANLLNTINPNDIESISVLKDASSTALYGQRAAAGVIIITTKKGGAGKTIFNFNTKLSVGEVREYTHVLTGDQVRAIVTQIGNPTYTSKLGSANTDWQRAIYQDAPATDNNLSASGTARFGNSVKIPFRISGGYLNQDGLLQTNNFERESAALNLNPKALKNNLSINLSAKYAHTKTRFANEGAIGSAVSFDPTQPVLLPYGKYNGFYETMQGNVPFNLATRNPVGLLQNQRNYGYNDRITANVQLDYKLPFFPDLHLQGNFGLDDAYGHGHNLIDSNSATNYEKHGFEQDFKQKKSNYLVEGFLFYNKDIKSIKSKVDVLVGHSYEDFYTNVYNMPAYNQRGLVDSTSLPTYLTDKPEYRLEAYLGRVNFTYNDKYLVTGSLRRDGSSKFASNHRVSYFPAGAFAWKIKQQFFKNTRFINELKVRVGYGETGNQEGIGYYSYIPNYYQSTSTAQYQFGGNYYYFYRPAAYNTDVKWETTDNTNLGLDYAFLNNRISGSVDLYERKSKNLLSVIPIAPGSNFDISLLYNVGNLTNRGIEASLNITPIKTKNYTWDINVNGSYNKSKITNLLLVQNPNFKGISVGGIAGGTGNTVQKDLVGYSPNYFYVMQQVYDAAGHPIEGLYEDRNRDGVVNTDDSYLAKPSSPDFVFGFSTQLNYKKFYIGAAGHGTAGNYNYNNVNSNSGTLNNIQNPLGFVGNATTNYLKSGFVNPQYFSDYYLENASFLKIDNINIGYNYGRFRNSHTALRLSASVQNVATITKYKGNDPEIAGAGIDNNIYPRPITYSLGASLDF